MNDTVNTTISRPFEVIGLLSSMYLCKPSKNSLEHWKDMLCGDTLIFLQDLKREINAIDTNSDDEMEDLLWEYTRLFIGPYRLPCPPWESVYVSPKKLMLQDAASQVMSIYREAGFTLDTADVLPDHIGAELNFLALLLRKSHTEGEQNECYITLTQKFLSEHLVNWVSNFTEDVENAAELPFYKTLARLTRTMIMADSA